MGILPRARSGERRALRVDVYRVHRLTPCHEEPIALGASKAHVGTALGQENAADELAGRVEDGHAVQPLAATPAAPEIAVRVAPEAVRNPRAAVDEDAAAS